MSKSKTWLDILAQIIALIGAIFGTIIAYEMVRWFILRSC